MRKLRGKLKLRRTAFQVTLEAYVAATEVLARSRRERRQR